MPDKPLSAIRLQKEYLRLKREPIADICAEPRPENILEWHFVIKGPADSAYAGGAYHGMLKFPSNYPYAPPSIMMLTPNGRFSTNTRLCLSMSDFHPESWVPAWSVASILNGVLSFMLESTPTVGSIETSVAERHRLALTSHAFNRKTKLFLELFPEMVVEPTEDEAAETAAAGEQAAADAERGGGWSPWLFLVAAVAVVPIVALLAQQQ